MKKPASSPDELDGPLFRLRVPVITETFNRTTGEWVESHLSSTAQYTVFKRGDTIDLQTTQPVFDLSDIPIRILIEHLLKALGK